MRNFIVVILFILFACFSASAQKIKFGITAGPVFTTSSRESINISSGDTAQDFNRSVSGIFSYFGGVVASIPISKSVIFRPQLQYILKGWKNHFDYQNPADDYITKFKANYVEIPLNFVYNIPTQNGRFFLGLGPSFSYVLVAKVYDYSDDSVKVQKFVFDNSGNEKTPTANRIDISGNAIIGYEFRNGLYCTLNYSHGFRNFRVYKKDDDKHSNKFTTVGLGIGYMFK